MPLLAHFLPLQFVVPHLGAPVYHLPEWSCVVWTFPNDPKLRTLPATQRPETIRAAATCRELRWCHSAFQRAEMLAKVKPENARRIYGEILSRAPEDSEIYRAARAKYEALAGR